MKPAITIQIPKPCRQPWDEMTSKAGGRHCTACAKTVTDFTRMSDAQILEMLHSSTGGCGRFKADQLGLVLIAPPAEKRFSFTAFYKVAASLLLVFSAGRVAAQKKIEIQLFQSKTPLNYTGSFLDSSSSEKTETIFGNFKDQYGNPIIDADVKVYFSGVYKTSTRTNRLGNISFSLNNTYNKKDWYLVLSKKGYTPLYITLNLDDLPSNNSFVFIRHQKHLEKVDEFVVGKIKITSPEPKKWWQFWKRT